MEFRLGMSPRLPQPLPSTSSTTLLMHSTLPPPPLYYLPPPQTGTKTMCLSSSPQLHLSAPAPRTSATVQPSTLSRLSPNPNSSFAAALRSLAKSSENGGNSESVAAKDIASNPAQHSLMDVRKGFDRVNNSPNLIKSSSPPQKSTEDQATSGFQPYRASTTTSSSSSSNRETLPNYVPSYPSSTYSLFGNPSFPFPPPPPPTGVDLERYMTSLVRAAPSLPSYGSYASSSSDLQNLGFVSSIPPPPPPPPPCPPPSASSLPIVSTSKKKTKVEESDKLKPSQSTPPPFKKPLFVRPFEDDYKSSKVEQASSSVEMEKNNNSDIDIKLADDDNKNPIKASSNKVKTTKECKNDVSCIKNGAEKTPPPPHNKSCGASRKPSSKSIKSKEKLKYLRYFRLITHRKKNDVEIEKLERRKSRLQERSPSPPPLSLIDSFRPTLPLPSPHHLTESHAKIMYMTALGLFRLPEDEKREREDVWNVILEDRLYRGSLNTSSNYFIRLRNMTSSSSSKRNNNIRNGTFLYPTKTKITTTNSSKLPINLSTLRPVSKSMLEEVKNVDPSISHLNVGGTSVTLNSSIPVPFTWPGVDTVMEAYQKYHRERNEELQGTSSRMATLQQKVFKQRSKLDALSTKLASLSRQQSTNRIKQTHLQSNIDHFTSVLAKLGKL